MSDNQAEGGRNGRRFSFSPGWAAVILTLLVAFYQFAIIGAQVANNARRIDQIETKNDALVTSVGRIDTRTARIETTLDIMFRGRQYRPLSAPLPPGDNMSEPQEVPIP